MTEKELMQICRYYNGEQNNPYDGKDQNKAMLWFYERCWVHDTSKAQMQGNGNVYAEYEREYATYGLEQFNASDGVPMSLKALLFNRYGRDSYSMADAVDGFKEFYNKYYK